MVARIITMTARQVKGILAVTLPESDLTGHPVDAEGFVDALLHMLHLKR